MILRYVQVRLIASVPGYHSGPSLKKWGHMKLRSVLQECTFDEEFKKSPLVYQVQPGCRLSCILFWVWLVHVNLSSSLL